MKIQTCPRWMMMMVLGVVCSTAAPANEQCYLDAQAIISAGGDMTRARSLFEQAALEGHAKARGVLGYMQLTGTGGSKDEASALINLKAASDAGIASAMVNLGSMYEKGLGVPVDMPAALTAYEKAAAAGSPEGRKRVIDIFYFGRDGMAPDFAKALPFVQAAANEGDAHACNLLGTMHEFGQAVETDLGKALHWFRIAAMKGELKAQCNLGRLLRQTSTLQADLLEAYRWIRLSAEKGEITAKVILMDFEKGFSEAEKSEVAAWIAGFPETAGKPSHPPSKDHPSERPKL
ncbi:MAG: sel1 repeat family protein [Akkermansiaceae bacterium]|nr:sel1 repeat family protein [Akkermansiaceae bacterium]